jgi:hypothetical protein
MIIFLVVLVFDVGQMGAGDREATQAVKEYVPRTV